jgi:sirohydrochlorin cobaltochelatase
MKARILFAHGARNPGWAQPILAIRDAMRARQPEVRVEAAFLEFIEPSLPKAIDTLVDAGHQDIVIVPMFMAQSGHTKRDLPALLDEARRRHPDLRLEVAAPIGEASTVVAAIAEYALSV